MGTVAEKLGFAVEHTRHLSKNIGSLLLDARTSDITLKIGDALIPAHRAILASSCEYFSALLYGKMCESIHNEIVLKDIPHDAFMLLMRYIYTGCVETDATETSVVLELLEISHQYGIEQLETAISQHLIRTLSRHNVAAVFEVTTRCPLEDLQEACNRFMDENASSVLEADSFLRLPAAALEQIISRDTFSAKEIDIFRAVARWISGQSNKESSANILKHVRLSLIGISDLANIVRKSGLIDPNRILDAIEEKYDDRNLTLGWRTFVELETNIAKKDLGMQIFSGKKFSQKLSVGPGISPETRTKLLYELGRPYYINKIMFSLSSPSFSYYVDVSLNREDWFEVADYSKHRCHSLQVLYFEPTVVRYIRLLSVEPGKDTAGFTVNSLEAMLTEEPLRLEQGYPVPTKNVASPNEGARARQNCGSTEFGYSLGSSTRDHSKTIYRARSDSLIIELPQPYFVESLRLLLWDGRERNYSFSVSISDGSETWTPLSTFQGVSNKRWHNLRFKPMAISLIKVSRTSIYDPRFESVEVECPALGFDG